MKYIFIKNKMLGKSKNMAIIFCIRYGVLYATYNGFDRDENPIIPFLEFLQDVAPAGNKDHFIKLTNDILQNNEDINYYLSF